MAAVVRCTYVQMRVLIQAPAIVPWYIMTSPLTEAKTKKFFHEKHFFGLDSKNVIFFNQVRP